MRLGCDVLVVALVACAAGAGCQRPDPKCGTSDGCAADEFCRYAEAYGFLEDGNPSPINFDSYVCAPLPAHCAESTCECLTCAGDFACDACPTCGCEPSALCTDGDFGAIVGTFKE